MIFRIKNLFKIYMHTNKIKTLKYKKFKIIFKKFYCIKKLINLNNRFLLSE